MPDELLEDYKVGVVLSVEPAIGNKSLTACKVDIGGVEPITVVTAANNVRDGARVAVAPVGSKVLEKSGEEMEVKKVSVGGVKSEGMLCDSRMLGWSGGAEGLAAQMPDSIEIGAVPPSTKPRVKFEQSDSPSVPSVEVEPLFEKKLTKEEKKKIAEEKRKARKAAKESKKNEEN